MYLQKTCHSEHLDVGSMCCLFSIAELGGAKGVMFTIELLDCRDDVGAKLIRRGEWSCGSWEKKSVL